MAKKIYEETDIQAIANAIRSQNDLTDLYKVSQMDNAILALRMAKDVLPQDTVSGAVASFPDGSDNFPVVELIADITVVQEGSGDPSPSNVRAISSGWTGCNVHVADGETPHIIDDVYLIDWTDEAGTVYNGSLNVTTGLLTVDYILKTIDENSNLEMADNTIFLLDNFFAISEDTESIMCNVYTRGINRSSSSTVLSSNPNYSFCCKIGANGKRIMIKDTRFTTLEDFQTWLSNNNIQILVKLATPQTIQLTPTQVNTILGQNNISADTGDVEVTYRADVDLYIQKKINEAT